MASAAHDDRVAPRFLHHPLCISAGEDITIAEHRDGDRVLETGDRLPASPPRVVLRLGARVERNRRDSTIDGRARGVEVGDVLVINADAHFHGHGHVFAGPAPRPFGGSDDRVKEIVEEVLLPRQGRSPALAGHFGDWTPEVEVEVIDELTVDEDLGRLRHRRRVHAVELDRADSL